MNRHQRRANSRSRPTSDGLRAEAANVNVLSVAAVNLGIALYDQGKFDEAVTAYRQATRMAPDYAWAHCTLGNALRKQGKLTEAVASFRRAIRINPDFAEAYSNLGVAFYNQRKLDKAIASYRKAVALKPNFAEAYNNVGLALKELGRLSESRAAMEQAVSVARRNIKFRFDLGDITRFVEGDKNLVVLEQLAGYSASISSYCFKKPCIFNDFRYGGCCPMQSSATMQ